LVQLLLDPYYRTIKGFCVLIQKEWLSFGHKFTERLGVGQSEDASPEISPIFIQWLDCIFQVASQFPNAFEFTEEFLIAIVDQVLSNRFGNFLGNCPRERELELDVPSRTLCIWSFFESEVADRKQKSLDPLFLNPQHRDSVDSAPLYPIMSTSKFFIWDRFYQRFHFKFQESHQQHSQTRSVARKAAILQRQVDTLKQSLANASQEKKLLHAALQAALSSNAPSGPNPTDSIRHELDKLKDRHLTPSQQQNIQIQFCTRHFST
jgi:myotubularin-related protein 6/7/8